MLNSRRPKNKSASPKRKIIRFYTRGSLSTPYGIFSELPKKKSPTFNQVRVFTVHAHKGAELSKDEAAWLLQFAC